MAIGKAVQRVDGVAKVTGKARYTDDFTMPGMRVAKYLRSTIAHGKVVRIDTNRAKGLPGVDGVFTFDDIPKNLKLTAKKIEGQRIRRVKVEILPSFENDD